MKKEKEKPIGRVVKVHGWLDEGHTKAFAAISWNGKPPRNEIRVIREKDGETRFGGGVPIDDSEAEVLINLLKSSRGVDLDDVFASSSVIMENRKAGFTTENGGKIVIHRKGE